tara:strand:+ start:1129 stop:1590 length:462 start_codon:yes stop_codon:yes gene_type:complete
MSDRYVKVLQDFMINEKLCVMLDMNINEYDRPTFLHYINEELDIIRQEYKDNTDKFIFLADISLIDNTDDTLKEICYLVNKLEDKIMENIEKIIIINNNTRFDIILNFIEKNVNRLLFDKVVVDNNVADIISSAIKNKNIMETISHPVKINNS